MVKSIGENLPYNDKELQASLGAYYTPPEYAKLSAELIKKAVGDSTDFVIIDRCCGTGTLIGALPLEYQRRCVVSSYEYFEYHVLKNLYQDIVLAIIPHPGDQDNITQPLIPTADATTEAFYENLEVVLKNNGVTEKTKRILLENPPYLEHTSIKNQQEVQGGAEQTESWLKSELKNAIENDKTIQCPSSSRPSNDLANLFIWSGFSKVLKSPNDYYIVFAPIKYWKVQHLINKKFIDGYGLNRKHFHATLAFVSCILWKNETVQYDPSSVLKLKCYDIDPETREVNGDGYVEVKRIYHTLSGTLYNKSPIEGDTAPGHVVNKNGYALGDITESADGKRRATNSKGKPLEVSVKPLWSEDIVGYIVAHTVLFDQPRLNCNLTSAAIYDGHGFYVKRDRYLIDLIAFSISVYPFYNKGYKVTGFMGKSGDEYAIFKKHVDDTPKLQDFLKNNLLFCSLTNKASLVSFRKNDLYYKNEFCLDNRGGESDTEALKTLKDFKGSEAAKDLLKHWYALLDTVKKQAGDDLSDDLHYGPYQIHRDINKKILDDGGKLIGYKYPEINQQLRTLEELVAIFYEKEILPTLFRYDFVK